MPGKVVLLCTEDRKPEQLEVAVDRRVDVQWVDSAQDSDVVVQQCKDAVVIIVRPMELPADLPWACPVLKLIQLEASGTDPIDIKALAELGIKVASNRGGNAVAVAEYTIALIVGVYRRMEALTRLAKAEQWSDDAIGEWWYSVHELTGRTVGIIGGGQIGREVARRLHGWDCTLVYSDVVPMSPEVEKQLNIERLPLDDLIRTSDVLTLHVRLNEDTRGFIGHRELGMMKPSTILINTSRGGVVDEAALIRALKEGEIAGAGLDVLEREPTPADNPLLHMENVLVTPHLAGYSVEALKKTRAFAFENAARVLAGEEPLSVAEPQ